AILPALLAATPRLGTDCAYDPASLASQAENLVAAGTPIPEDLAEARDSVRHARLASPSLALALRGADLQYGHVLAALQRRGRSGADWIGENNRRLDAEDEAR